MQQALTATDFYKTDHRRQYPAGTNLVYSNLTARKSLLPGCDHIVFFGLQGFLKKYLIDFFHDHFFAIKKEDAVARYKRRLDNALGKDAVPVEHIGELWDVGYLPLRIKALPEGSLVPMRLPFVTIQNTNPHFFWLTNFIETLISAELWQPITSATMAYQYRKLLNEYADETVGDRDFVQWQGHDFSFRGMASLDAAMKSGAGHLLSFTGTDTIPAIDYLEDYYQADSDKELIGASVPATEHSVMCMGLKESEVDTYKRLITEVYPRGIVSIVSDTWDYWKVLTEYTPALKDIILSRAGKVVFRPDSGDPVKIICGDPTATEGSPAYKGSVEVLAEIFGWTQTARGYRTLDSHVGLIYGDSITLDRAKGILEGLKAKQFSSDNIVFGIGSYTYQYVTRDTFGMAVKSTYGEINNMPVPIFKDPKTDDGTKRSAMGMLAIIKNDAGEFELCENCSSKQEEGGELLTVFLNGEIIRKSSLAQIRKRLNG